MAADDRERAVAQDLAEPPVADAAAGRRMVRAVGGLTAVNVLVALVGFVTGPLQARALGADGRGDLAAILVPLTLAPQILGLSLGAYAAREAARGRAVGEIAGSLGAVALVVGVLGAAAGVPAAGYLAGDREVVRLFLTIVFLLLPLSLVTGVLYSMLGGLEKWRMLILLRVLPVLLGLVAMLVLYALDRLTVTSAAIVALTGAVVSAVPTFSILRGGRVRFSGATAREGVVFGVKNWLGGLASLANARLDQLLMIKLVAPQELGLYAVAVTWSSIPTFVTGALAPPLLTRIAQGHRQLVPRAMRLTLAMVLVTNLSAMAVTPLVLPLLFGAPFEEATDMALVLLAAALPLAGVTVLSTALVADGRPGVPSVGEAIALVITVPGLVFLLGPLGGLGAALVSLVAYSASLVPQLIAVRRSFGGRYRDYLIPRMEDVPAAIALIRRAR